MGLWVGQTNLKILVTPTGSAQLSKYVRIIPEYFQVQYQRGENLNACLSLQLLGSLEYADRARNVDFILSNQNPLTGGIGKSDNTYPDPLHTFMGIAGLSLVNYEGLSQINPALTMSEKAVSHLKSIQANWCS